MAPNANRYLAHDERIVIEVRRHVAVLLKDFSIAIGAIVAASFLGILLSPAEAGDLFDTILGLAAAFFVFRFLWKLWQWSVDRIFVTDQRVFEVSGVLTRRVASMPLSRVTDMTYQRSIGGRILGYGDLIVESAGQDQALSTIDHLPHPDDFYRTITSLVTAGLPSLLPDDGTIFSGKKEEDFDDTGPLPRVIV